MFGEKKKSKTNGAPRGGVFLDYSPRTTPPSLHCAPSRNKALRDWRRVTLGTRQSRCAVLRGAGSERAAVGGGAALVPVLIPPLFPCSHRRSPQAAPPRGPWGRGAELLATGTASATVRLRRGGEQAAPGRAVRRRRVRPRSPLLSTYIPELRLPGGCGAESPPTTEPGS